MDDYHYVYRITNIVENKHYYGSRTSGSVIPSNDIGIKYFSSSTDKEFMDDQFINPDNYKYKVVSIFDNRLDAIELESKLHFRFDVGNNPNFYNKINQTTIAIDFTGRSHTDDAKIKIGIASKERGISDKAKANLKWYSKNRVRTEEERLKMSIAKKGNSNATGKRSLETRLKMSESKKGKPSNMLGKSHSKSSKIKMSIAKQGDNNPKYWQGKKRDEETKSKISESRKGKNLGPVKKVQCPHCNKIGGINTMKRWHFDNCKNKDK